MATTGGARPQTRTSSRYIDSLYGIRPTTSTKSTATRNTTTRNTAPPTYVNPTTQLRQASVIPQATPQRIAASTGGGSAPPPSMSWSASGTGGGGGTGIQNANGALHGTGWAKPYTQEAWGNVLDNPAMLATDVLSRMGIHSPGLANDLGQAGDLGALYGLLMAGANAGQYDTNAQINYMGNYIRNLMTPGASTPSAQQLIDRVLGAHIPTDGASGDVIGTYLSTGNNGMPLSPTEQYQRINDVIGSAMSSMSPMVQVAMAGMLNNAATQYGRQFGKNPTGAPDDYLAFLRNFGIGNFY